MGELILLWLLQVVKIISKNFFNMTFFKKIFRSKNNNQSKLRKLEKFDVLNKSDSSIISLISAVYSEDSRSRNSLPSISNSSSNSSRESLPVFIKCKNPVDTKSVIDSDQENNLKSSLKNVKFGPEILSNPDLIGQKWYTRQNVYEVKRNLFNKYRINGSNGTFVIRSEVQNEKYSLYLSFIYNSRIRHHKILQKDQRGKNLYCLENVSVLSFPSIPALVQFYKLNSTPPLPCTLKE